MVGVAGRSKGCHTCKRRKVKCDEVKPVCYRCSRGGFNCLGYARQTEFKQFALPTSQHYPKKGLKLAASHGKVWLQDCSIPWSNGPPAELCLQAFESDICFARMFNNFVWASLGIGWMNDTAAGRCGILPFEALRALALTNLGRLEHTAVFKHKGAEQYGRVLRATADALAEPHDTTNEQTILSILILVMLGLYYPYRQWEAFLERGEGAEEEYDWGDTLQMDRAAVISHVEGMAQVIYLCGPEAFREPRMRSLFDCARMLLTVAAVYKSKRIQLEQHRWRSVPWALEPFAKTEQAKLFDIFVMVPGLLEDYERLSSIRSGRTTELANTLGDEFSQDKTTRLLVDITTQLQLLFRWRWDWQRRYGYAVRQVPTAQAGHTNPKDLRENHLDFSSLADPMVRAAEITLYNAILLWLLALLWNTRQCLVAVEADIMTCVSWAQLDSDAVFEPLSTPGRFLGLRTPAMEICHVYEWQSQHHHIAAQSTESILLYIYPLGLAMSVLEGDREVQEWISEMITNSPVTSGYKVGRFKMLRFSQLITKFMMN